MTTQDLQTLKRCRGYKNFVTKEVIHGPHEVEATSEWFHKDSSKPDGLGSQCKTCTSGYQKTKTQRNETQPKGKTCSQCKEYKPLSEYETDKTKKYGVRASCKGCRKEYLKRPEVEINSKQRRSEYRSTEAYKDLRKRSRLREQANARKLLVNDIDIEWLAEYFDYQCAYCLEDVVVTSDNIQKQAHIEHIQPKSRYGPYAMANYVLACRECNSNKSDTPYHEWWEGRGNHLPLNEDLYLLSYHTSKGIESSLYGFKDSLLHNQQIASGLGRRTWLDVIDLVNAS